MTDKQFCKIRDRIIRGYLNTCINGKTSYVVTGRSDKAGRWYPDANEVRSCCTSIRQPTRSYPWSLYSHCRSIKHIRNWYLDHPTDTFKYMMGVSCKSELALFINYYDDSPNYQEVYLKLLEV